MRDLTVGDRLDQYQIVDLLSRSGMASVFRAVDSESGETVALKVPHVQYESDVAFYERFRREEEIGLCLDHPNVVRVLRPLGEKSRMYLVMEYVEGQSLRALVRSQGRLPLEQALDVGRQLCEALSHLHRHGVVHRDLKPENVHLLASSGAVKLLDFGIALLDSARRLTWAGLSGTLGTPDYMAPEQVRGRRGDARTDVYALGTILYELLTGRLPYEAPSAAALLHAKVHRAPTPPSERSSGFPRSLEAVLLRAIARDPRDRYPSAEDLRAALADPAAAQERLPSPAPRASARWTTFRPWLLGGLVGSALAVGALWETSARHAAAGSWRVAQSLPSRPAASR